MTARFQVTFDAADPRALGQFWCAALGYIEQPPPPGFDTWEDALEAFGIDTSDPNAAYAIVDPEGTGPRCFFQKVPEAKAGKNRVHLDVAVGGEELHARAQILAEQGGRVGEEFDVPSGHWITMLDPEGNEFCLQGLPPGRSG